MNTNKTIEYEIPTEEELDVSVQAAERRGIRIGIEKMLEAAKTSAKSFCDGKRIYVGEETLLGDFDLKAAGLLAEQGKK